MEEEEEEEEFFNHYKNDLKRHAHESHGSAVRQPYIGENHRTGALKGSRI